MRLTEARTAPAPGDDPRGRAIADRFPKDRFGGAHDVVLGAASNAPYLATLCERHTDWLETALARDAADVFAELLDGLAADCSTRAEMMAVLRVAKARAALLIALCDLGEVWDLDRVTTGLSDLADAAVSRALTFLLDETARRGKLPSGTRPTTSGYVVLGMGKLGARELNYSSDVDLVCLFDHGRMGGVSAGDAQQTFARLTRDLSQMLSERTKDGYVFRVDLRLRPDPGAMPLAVAVRTAETYYEGLGRTWERLAYIKARPIAGDTALGTEFLETLRPFVWRRHLEFSTLADVRALKTRIHDHYGHGAPDGPVAGHDLKRGRGGIREVEFYAQTQQIIAGGRDPSLRERRTDAALDALVEAGWTKPETRDVLMAAYRDYRDAEHRIQMLADAQTQTVPTDPTELARLARLCGDADETAFSNRVHDHLTRVSAAFDALFDGLPQPEAPGLPGRANLAASLEALGFARPGDGAEIVHNWSKGRYPALRSERAREALEAVTPALLEALSRNPDPDRSLSRFDGAVGRLPTGLQLFSMLASRPKLLDLYAEIVGLDAPIAEELARRPDILGASLSPEFWSELPDASAFHAALAEAIGRAEGVLEAAMDAARAAKAGLHFRIAVHIMRGLVTPLEGAAAFTALAEACVAALLPVARADAERRHGAAPDASLAVVALGRVGAGSMTATSDLDLIYIYDGPPGTTGPRPVPLSKWASGTGQALLTALTVPTAEGTLYEVDMRLRPSGKSGPLATTLDAFRTYHRETAQTWEALALTRARVIAGDDAFVAVVRRALADAQASSRDAGRAMADVAAMRERVAKDRKPRGPWDVKLLDGGLFDLDFVIQGLQIISGRAAEPLTPAALSALAADGSLSTEESAALGDAYADYAAVSQTIAVMAPDRHGPDEMSRRVVRALSETLDVPDADGITARLEERQRAVKAVFRRVVVEGEAR